MLKLNNVFKDALLEAPADAKHFLVLANIQRDKIEVIEALNQEDWEKWHHNGGITSYPFDRMDIEHFGDCLDGSWTCPEIIEAWDFPQT